MVLDPRLFRFVLLSALLLVAGFTAGCGPRPQLFPAAPLHNGDVGGHVEREYDSDGNGSADFVEVLDASGRVAVLRLGDIRGTVTELQWPQVGPDVRDLIIIIDSVPHHLVCAAREQGRLRLFHAPSRTIAPFPAMTDPALDELFHLGPCLGVESLYYDGERLSDAVKIYIEEHNMPWHSQIDYALGAFFHAFSYRDPHKWLLHELGKIDRKFFENSNPRFAAYVVSSSGLGATFGRDGHHAALLTLDRFCQSIVQRSGGRVRITLLSDHGHNLQHARRIELDDHLRRAGYRLVNRLERPGDVVAPEWGLIDLACLYTRTPARVAQDIVGFEGVELAVFRDEQGVVTVVSRDGQARVRRDGELFRYEPLFGDPLALRPIMEKMQAAGVLRSDGAARDADWLAATSDHIFPDPLARLENADRLFRHPPDVYVSLAPGYYAGSVDFNKFIGVSAAHGGLRDTGTCGFIMSTAGPLPPLLRNSQIAAELERLGVRVRRAGAAH